MAILIFIIGTIIGSFLLVVGTRLPIGEDIVFSRSKCDHCQKTLKWYNLIPIISFIVQKGKCSFCHKKISKEYLLVELLTGLLYLIVYLYFKDGYYFYGSLVIVSLLIVTFVSDFKYMIILDSSLVTTILLFIILKFIYQPSTIIYSIISGILLFLVMLLVSILGKILFKKDSLGGGDIKLAFVIGFILGIKLGLVAIILSSFLALPYALGQVYLENNHQFPYGPFLIGALLIVFMFSLKFTNLLNYLFI